MSCLKGATETGYDYESKKFFLHSHSVVKLQRDFDLGVFNKYLVR